MSTAASCCLRLAVCLSECRDALRAGKRFLKEANGSAAMVRFEKALMLSKAISDKVRCCGRGAGCALERERRQ